MCVWEPKLLSSSPFHSNSDSPTMTTTRNSGLKKGDIMQEYFSSRHFLRRLFLNLRTFRYSLDVPRGPFILHGPCGPSWIAKHVMGGQGRRRKKRESGCSGWAVARLGRLGEQEKEEGRAGGSRRGSMEEARKTGGQGKREGQRKTTLPQVRVRQVGFRWQSRSFGAWRSGSMAVGPSWNTGGATGMAGAGRAHRAPSPGPDMVGQSLPSESQVGYQKRRNWVGALVPPAPRFSPYSFSLSLSSSRLLHFLPKEERRILSTRERRRRRATRESSFL